MQQDKALNLTCKGPRQSYGLGLHAGQQLDPYEPCTISILPYSDFVAYYLPFRPRNKSWLIPTFSNVPSESYGNVQLNNSLYFRVVSIGLIIPYILAVWQVLAHRGQVLREMQKNQGPRYPPRIQIDRPPSPQKPAKYSEMLNSLLLNPDPQ